MTCPENFYYVTNKVTAQTCSGPFLCFYLFLELLYHIFVLAIYLKYLSDVFDKPVVEHISDKYFHIQVLQ